MPSCDLDNKLISGEDYEAIADLYAAARRQILGINQYLLDAVYQVVMIDVCVPEVDLLNSFWTAYELSTNEFQIPQSFLGAVRSLNAHVLERGGYDDVDDYLAAESILVDQEWADLSAEVGYTISNTYINP